MVRIGLVLALVLGVMFQASAVEHQVVNALWRLGQASEAASEGRALCPAGTRRRGQRRGKRSAGSRRRAGLKPAAIEQRRRQRMQRRRRRLLSHVKPALREVLTQIEAAQSPSTEAQNGGAGVEETELGQAVNPLPPFQQAIEVVVVKPDYSECRCPKCHGTTKRVKAYYSHPWDAHLEQAVALEVYREVRRCTQCRKRFAPGLDFVDLNGRYTMRVKRMAVAAVVEDGMAVQRVPERMRRDFHVPALSVQTVHEWVKAAAGQVPAEGEYTRWVVERFSGVIGLDEVVITNAKGQKQYLTVAVDALNHRTIVFDLLNARDHTALVKFLKKLKELGIRPEVVITDMWKAYAGALAEVFPEARQQLCVFHVIQDVMKHVNKAMLTYRRGLPQATPADKALRKELLEFRYVLLTSSHKLSPAQRERVEELLRQHTGTLLAEAYYCKEAVLTLFRVSRTPEAARQRRDQLVQRFGGVPELKAIITLLNGEWFDQMIVYLEYENLDKTNNDVERTNRTYQQGEKQRYRARTDETRLNYVKLQARRRNRQNADHNDRLKRKPPPVERVNVDDIAHTAAQSLA
jgi:transposase